MVGPGTLEIGFSVTNHPEVIKATKDVQTAYETLIASVVKARSQLDTAATGWDGMEAKMTKFAGAVKTMGPEIETNLIGKFKNGILQLNNVDLSRTQSAIDASRQKFAALGQTVLQNATSFGILSASTFGIINSISNLERQSVMLEQRQLRLQTSTTTLHQAELALATAKNNSSTSSERLAVLEERVANARTKLQVETGKLSVAQQDYNENLGAFWSQIVPQIVNVGAAGAQAFSGLTKAIKENKISFQDIKNVISGLFASKPSVPTIEFTGALSNMGKEVNKSTGLLGGLKNAFSGLGGAIMIGGLVALGGFLVSIGLDAYETQKKVADLRAELTLLGKGTEAYYRNLAAQAAAFNKSRVGQIGEFLANNQVTLFGTKPVIGFKFTEVAKNQTSELLNTIRADLIKEWNTTMDSPEMKMIGLLPQNTQDMIKQNMAKILAFIKTDVNWQDLAHAETTIGVAEPLAKGINDALNQIGPMILGAKPNIDLSKMILGEMNNEQVVKAMNVTIAAFRNVVSSGAVPVGQLSDKIKAFVGVIAKGNPVLEEAIPLIIEYVTTHLNKLAPVIPKTTKEIDEFTKKIKEHNAAIQLIASAYLSYENVQNTSVAALDQFNQTLGVSIDNVRKQADSLRAWATAEQVADDTTLMTVDTLFDYIEAMQNVNKINDGSIQSWIAMRQAHVNGIQSIEKFITDTKLQKIEMDAANATLLDYVTNVDGIKVPPGMVLTTEELKKLHQGFVETGDAAAGMAKIMAERLKPAFDSVAKLTDAKSFKDMKKAFDELEIGGVSKKLEKSTLKAIEPFRQSAEHARQATQIFNLLMTYGDQLTKKDYASWFKKLGQEIDRIKPQKGMTDNFKNMLSAIGKMTPEQLRQHATSIDMILRAYSGDSPSGAKVDIGEQSDAINQFNKEVGAGADPLETINTKLNKVTKQFNELGKAAAKAKQPISEVGVAAINAAEGRRNAPTTTTPKKPETAVHAPQPEKEIPPPEHTNFDTVMTQLEDRVKNFPGTGVTVKPTVIPAPTFAPVDLSNITTGVALAEQDLGSVLTFINGLKLTFTQPIVTEVAKGTAQAEVELGTIIPFIAGLKLVFNKPDVGLVIAGATQANAAIKTTQTFISGMKMAYQYPNVDQIIKSVGDARKSIATVKTAIDSLKLKFPKPDTSQVDSAVSHIKSELNSIPKEIVTHHKVVEDKAFGGIVSMQEGGMWTSRHQQTFQVSDNPTHQESIAFLPHEPSLAEPVLKQIQSMFPAFFASRQGGNRVVRENRIVNTVENRTTPTNLYATFIIDLGKELGKVRKIARINIGEFNIS